MQTKLQRWNERELEIAAIYDEYKDRLNHAWAQFERMYLMWYDAPIGSIGEDIFYQLQQLEQEKYNHLRDAYTAACQVVNDAYGY